MSIRTNPKKAVPLMLKRLKMIKNTMQNSKLEELTTLLNEKQDLFKKVKYNGDKFLDVLKYLDDCLRELKMEMSINEEKFEADMDFICKQIKETTQKLLPMGDDTQGESRQPTKIKSLPEIEGLSSDPSSSHKNSTDIDHPKVSYEKLEEHLKPCVMSLLVFPENAVIRKRHIIYWWIGEGFVNSTQEKTAEEVGEGVIDELLNLKTIIAFGNGLNPVVKRFKINPETRRELKSLNPEEKQQHACLVLRPKKVTLGNDSDHLQHEHLTSVFNVSASYLDFVPQWLVKMKNLEVLQLGRWQDSPLHHIEVASTEFLEELKVQKQLKYLSLRGISRIPELPSSIAQLRSLEILDLKACHNLETLPTDIASMRSLTHLDVSECYLLDSMPKGIEKLTQLQVLKGFVIGSASKTPCRITDLANLKKLKRLSIHIGSEAVIQEKEFEGLKDLTAVKCLKISWGVFDRYRNIQVLLPPSLEKLDLEGFPGTAIPEWLKPSRVPERLRKLYIKGGNLKSLDHGEICHKWHVEILRLKYLKQLQLEERKSHKLFPSLRYLEKANILTRSYSEWRLEE